MPIFDFDLVDVQFLLYVVFHLDQTAPGSLCSMAATFCVLKYAKAFLIWKLIINEEHSSLHTLNFILWSVCE